MKLDFSLESAAERTEFVRKLLEELPQEQKTPRYLEILSDYIIFALDKEERKQKKIITDNRSKRIKVRETSFQGLISKLENGEDGIYNMIANDKNIIFSPKVEITDADVAAIPELKLLRDAIHVVEEQAKTARGKRAFLLKKQAIEMRKDQYVIKNTYTKPIYCMNLIKSFSRLDLSEEIKITKDGDVVSSGMINLFNPVHISALLCNYSRLKEDSWAAFSGDAKWMIMDLEKIVDLALKEKFPLYYDIVIYKIDGKKNTEIQDLLEQKYEIRHSVEYISSLWRNKIPKIIAEKAKEEYLIWYYTYVEKGQWKKCSRCGQIKLAHNKFFSKNKTSKDHFYSICKECRNKKN